MGALVADPGLAALAGEAGRAAAGVRALARVPAGGAVLAGPVGDRWRYGHKYLILG